jgi:hypothetical protein
LPPGEATLDLHDKDVSAPAVLDRLLDVPETLFGLLHKIEKPHVVAPRNLSNNLLDN